VFTPKLKSPQDYIDRATACEALADAATAPETRDLAGGGAPWLMRKRPSNDPNDPSRSTSPNRRGS